MLHFSFFFFFLFFLIISSFDVQVNHRDPLVWLHLHPRACAPVRVITLASRPLGVSVVMTWQRPRWDKAWCLCAAAAHSVSAVSAASHSVPVPHFSVCLSPSGCFSLMPRLFSLPLLTQLRVLRYAVPLAMIGFLYYKVRCSAGSFMFFAVLSLLLRKTRGFCNSFSQRFQKEKTSEIESCSRKR